MSSAFFTQAALALVDVLPYVFTQAKTPKIRRFDCIIGLIGEPFWFYYGLKTGQWSFLVIGGIFFPICAYSFYHKWILGDLTYGEDSETLEILNHQSEIKQETIEVNIENKDDGASHK